MDIIKNSNFCYPFDLLKEISFSVYCDIRFKNKIPLLIEEIIPFIKDEIKNKEN